MKINKVTPSVSVAPQIQIEDVKEIAEMGFKSIICNRPDGEEPHQPAFSNIEQEAKKCGLDIVHLPVIGGEITNEDIAGFKNALEELPSPLLAYCRSGTRSITLWSLVQASEKQEPSEILEATKAAGYDMSGVI